jgi:hypothetical protein
MLSTKHADADADVGTPRRKFSSSSLILIDDTELDLEWLLLVGVEGGVYVLAWLRDRVSTSILEIDLRVEVGDGGGVVQVIGGP